jgi:SET domain
MSAMNISLTLVIYMSEDIKVQFGKRKGNRRVIVKEDVRAGEIIIIELGIKTRKRDLLLKALDVDDNLRNTLFPRVEVTSEVLKEKVDKNLFILDELDEFENMDELFVYGLYDQISAINHSCDANCMVKTIDTDADMHTVMGVYSVKYIKKGGEVTICYGGEVGHTGRGHFHCSCGLDKVQREMLEDERCNAFSPSFHMDHVTHCDMDLSKRIMEVMRNQAIFMRCCM